MNKLLTTPALTVYEHMALDETAARTRPQGALLRFYNWQKSPAVTFGYAQFINEVRKETAARGFKGAICRRPTGGGLVYHIDDLTFSLIFPSQEKPAAIYKDLHARIHEALVQTGMPSQVFAQKMPTAAYAPSQHHQANACFVNPVENDLLAADGQKMLGGAIRRFDGMILYQGSLQEPDARHRPAYKQALIQAVRDFLKADFQITAAPADWLEKARQLADTQYNTPAWTEKF